MAEDLSSTPVQGGLEYQQGLANLALTQENLAQAPIRREQALAGLALTQAHVEGAAIQNKDAQIKLKYEEQSRKALAEYYENKKAIAERPGHEANIAGVLDEQIQTDTDLAQIFNRFGDPRGEKYMQHAATLAVAREKFTSAGAQRHLQESKLLMSLIPQYEERLAHATDESFPYILQDFAAELSRHGQELPEEVKHMPNTSEARKALHNGLIKARDQETQTHHKLETLLRNEKRLNEEEQRKAQVENIKARTEGIQSQTAKREAEAGKAAEVKAAELVQKYFLGVDKDTAKELTYELAFVLQEKAKNRANNINDPHVQELAAAELKEARLQAGKMKFPPTQEDWISRALIANPGMTRAQVIAAGREKGKVSSSALH